MLTKPQMSEEIALSSIARMSSLPLAARGAARLTRAYEVERD